MIYSRIITEDDSFSEIIEQLNLEKKAEYAFYDLIYLNKNGTSITEDTLKIRVYQKNEWNNQVVLVIRKTASVINNVKEDKVLLNKEFNNEKAAIDFVNKHLGNIYEYKFKLEKNGVEYANSNLRVWVENIKNIGISIEFGSNNSNSIEKAISLFKVKERLKESVPEYLYNKFLNDKR